MRSVWSCSEWGLACCALLPGARCALTAPFHPYLCRLFRRPSAVLLSVPLSVALPRPAVSRHSALRSPDFPPRTPCGGTRRLSVRPVCRTDYSRNGQGRLKVCFLCGKHLLSDGLTGRDTGGTANTPIAVLSVERGFQTAFQRRFNGCRARPARRRSIVRPPVSGRSR